MITTVILLVLGFVVFVGGILLMCDKDDLG